jgi:hypothetical protein
MKGDDTGWFGNADIREKTGGVMPLDKIVLGGGVEFPLEIVYNKLFITGKTGSGKSWTAGVLMEEFERTGLQFVCWDALNAHSGLQKLDGVEAISPQEDQTIDMPAFINRLKQSGKSVVINLMGLSLGRQQQLVGDYCVALLEANFVDDRGSRKSLMTIFEECQDFVPQQGRPLSFEPIVRLCKLGRALGFGVSMISQRPAAVNKEALSQASVYLIHNVIQFRDLKALEEQMGFGNDRALIKRITAGIASAKSGECVAFSPDFFRDQGYIVIGKIRGDRRADHGGINIEVRPRSAPAKPEPRAAEESSLQRPQVSMDPGSLGALSQSGFGSEGNTMSALSESGFGNPSRPSESKYEDDRTIFRPLRPIMEYDPNSDPKNDFGSGIAYEAPVEEEPQHRNLSPALGVSAIVLLASGIYVLTKPSSK